MHTNFKSISVISKAHRVSQRQRQPVWIYHRAQTKQWHLATRFLIVIRYRNVLQEILVFFRTYNRIERMCLCSCTRNHQQAVTLFFFSIDLENRTSISFNVTKEQTWKGRGSFDSYMNDVGQQQCMRTRRVFRSDVDKRRKRRDAYVASFRLQSAQRRVCDERQIVVFATSWFVFCLFACFTRHKTIKRSNDLIISLY